MMLPAQGRAHDLQLVQRRRIRRQTLDQHLEDAATGERHPRARCPALRVTVAQQGDAAIEGARLQAFQEILLDTAAGQRTGMVAIGARHQQGAGLAWRRTEGGQHRAQPDRFAAARPVQCPLDDLQIEMLHAQLVSCVPIGRRRMRLPVAAARALTTAGASGGTGGSPIPVGALAEATICTSTVGISLMRSSS
ncbi:hypothetical protein D3C80_917190 [compost metagenome]